MTAATRLLPLILLVAAGPAIAQYQDPYEREPVYHDAPVPENVSYGYAQVLRADEVFETVHTRVPEERCDDTEHRQTGRTTGGTVIGAIVGAALGNQVGKGDGRRAATVAGAVAGGMVGHNIAQRRAEAEARGCTLVEVEREERQVVGYDVEYMYKGEKYMSRLPYDPGNRLRIRVSVMPDDGGTASR